jgi:hypothetical protein
VRRFSQPHYYPELPTSAVQRRAAITSYCPILAIIGLVNTTRRRCSSMDYGKVVHQECPAFRWQQLANLLSAEEKAVGYVEYDTTSGKGIDCWCAKVRSMTLLG